MPVKTVTSPSSAPQVTFRQATRGVSNENGLCQARHIRSCNIPERVLLYGKDQYSTGNAMFIPTYNKRTNALNCQKSETLFKHVEKRMRSQDKYYLNFYEFLKLSRACDIV